MAAQLQPDNSPDQGLAEAHAVVPSAAPAGSVTLRSILISIPLVAVNCYWIIEIEGIWHSNHATAMSLFWNTVFFLFLLVVLNVAVLKRYFPRKALSQGELITIFTFMTIGSALAGHDSLQLGIPAAGGFPVWFQSQQSTLGWDKFNGYYPNWAMVKDPAVLKPYYEGLGSQILYTKPQLMAWLLPTLWWCAFIVALGTAMICVNVFIRKQWMENEKLSYPIVQLPMALTDGGGTLAFFKQKPFWIGFALGASLDIYNGLATLYPSIPLIPVRHDYAGHDLGQYFTTYPWNAMGSVPLPLYPFIIAIGYFLPLDLSFSLWFFFVLKKLLLVATAAIGVEAVGAHSFPYLTEQSFGAWCAIFLMAAWTARAHLGKVWHKIVTDKGLDDTDEPMTYRMAFLLLILAGAFLFYFCYRAGMTPGIIVGFFAIYFIISIGITRIRAELGPPAHEMAGNMNSPFILSLFLGTAAVGLPNLTMMTMFWWFTGRGYRTHPMPGQLESFKMGKQSGMDMRKLGYAMILAFFVGGFFSFWAAIHLQYNAGVNVMTAHNWGEFQWLKSQVDSPQHLSQNTEGQYAVLFGGLVAVGMMYMRTRFIWWPLHPAGYAISMTFGAEYYWFCLVLSSLIKFLVLRYGGYKLNRRVMPLMFGLILGEYLVGAGWSGLSVLLNAGRIINIHTYDFCPG